MTKRFDELIEALHAGINPYAGVVADKPDVTGWDSEHPWFIETIAHLAPRTIIEVGSYKGASAIHMARALEAPKADAAIICIDTWLGDNEWWEPGPMRDAIHFRNGRPEFYEIFLKNIVHHALAEYIVPLAMPSVQAGRYLRAHGVTAQMIYIDGCHERGEVHRDLAMYWSLLDEGGVMLIDDFDFAEPHFEGLICDVIQFTLERNLPLSTLGRKVRLMKGANQ